MLFMPPRWGLGCFADILPTAYEAVNGLKYANICFGVSGVLTLPRVRSLTADNQRIVPLTRRIPASMRFLAFPPSVSVRADGFMPPPLGILVSNAAGSIV